MAITIINQKTSNAFYPAGNPINVTVNSNNSGNCNFRYICDFYINGTKVFTDKLFPDPTTGYGFFQCSRVIQDYINNALPTTSQITGGVYSLASTGTPQPLVSVYFKFGEEYDSTSNCTGPVTQYTNLSTSNTFYVFNAALDYEDWPSYTDTPYRLNWSTSERKFLTNSPRSIDIGFNESYYLDLIASSAPTNGTHVIWIRTRYFDGGYNDWTIPVGTQNAYKLYRIAVGPYNLNKYFGAPFPITQFVKSYEVAIRNGSNYNLQYSEQFEFKMRKPKAFETRIGFIERMGSVGYFTFYHRNKKSYAIDRKNYKKLLTSNYSGSWTYQVGDRSDTTYAINANETHAVSSFMNRNMSEYIAADTFLTTDAWISDDPQCINFRVFPESYSGGSSGGGVGDPQTRIGNPTSGGTKMLFWFEDVSDFSVGDSFYCYPNANATWVDYSNIFTIQSISGNIVDCGLIYGIFNITNYAEGFIVKMKNWRRLPIVITDTTVEEKQKISKPIEYTINYQMAYNKNTLRG